MSKLYARFGSTVNMRMIFSTNEKFHLPSLEPVIVDVSIISIEGLNLVKSRSPRIF